MPLLGGQSLFASTDDLTGLHRTVVRVGATAAWFVAAVYLALGVFFGDDARFVEAMGPVLAASLMTAQIMVGREDGGIALFGSGMIVAVWYTAFGTPSTVLPAAMSLVVIAALGMLFVDRWRQVTSFAVAICLGLMPVLWTDLVDDGVVIGLLMALSFMMTDFILTAIKTSATDLNRRYEMLFRDSPTAALEEDWSRSLEYVRSEYTGKPERIKEFLHAYPTVVKRAISHARVLRVNDTALALLGIKDPARFLGNRNPDVIVDENFDTFVSALTALYSGQRRWEQEFPTTSPTGQTRWLSARTVVSTSGRPGSSIVVALADITHVKERNDAMAELVRAKDDFIASISHEIRTPLTAVVGLSAELNESPSMPKEERIELLKLVADQAAEMSNIVEDLLVAARLDRGTVSVELEPVDLVSELVSTVEGLGVTVDMPVSRPPEVDADPRRLRQVLRNLLTNAVRYGGPRIRVLTGSQDDNGWIEVRDNGSGVPPEQAAKIFEPYATASTAVQGSVGLGLAVARQLAELMDGTLRYERNGSESVFRLELPLVTSRKRSLASQAAKP